MKLAQKCYQKQYENEKRSPSRDKTELRTGGEKSAEKKNERVFMCVDCPKKKNDENTSAGLRETKKKYIYIYNNYNYSNYNDRSLIPPTAAVIKIIKIIILK
ncbi:hypothetical protein, unlikely [Trypanosoma brucei gambiense DAL972]|uniref:Uncharacterized protein n=1 Tax=Trypanosoma brucei gambiense (strain MHOM/CI/86/DAL972) TaxID=679716 RepID=C9ZSG9_TRYB9|nr:hypothetical protein, unlikely [Trypanosoma brucei gambiense DAL972]CBH12353.1 hypothetical protein, unlikely [Trypanosoma brucei gambiense DAL972]|eukprot:XP_011774634.1 hypothetical protein, unlikely [Trypanosoma brucei gambiense DAL972]